MFKTAEDEKDLAANQTAALVTMFGQTMFDYVRIKLEKQISAPRANTTMFT